jgi:hypothetical protein
MRINNNQYFFGKAITGKMAIVPIKQKMVRRVRIK